MVVPRGHHSPVVSIFSSSSLSNSSLDVSRAGGGGSGLRRSNSVCDVRQVEGSNNAFYATVTKTGKVAQPVVRRERREDADYYINNRQIMIMIMIFDNDNQHQADNDNDT